MKKLISVSVLMFFVISMITCAADNKPAKAAKTSVNSASKVEVYYFHFTRRCVTCQAVETESKAAIAALYAKQGKVSFTQVNLDDAGSDAIAKKCKVSGQTLLVVKGNTRVDLTDKGFMYAKSNPDKLKAELKKVIDPLL